MPGLARGCPRNFPRRDTPSPLFFRSVHSKEVAEAGSGSAHSKGHTTEFSRRSILMLGKKLKERGDGPVAILYRESVSKNRTQDQEKSAGTVVPALRVI